MRKSENSIFSTVKWKYNLEFVLTYARYKLAAYYKLILHDKDIMKSEVEQCRFD